MTVRIENWCLCTNASPYQAPELAEKYLHGEVYGHPRHPNGKAVNTSAVVGVTNGVVKTVSGSLYDLGEVNPEYEKKYPGARDRLLANEP